MKPLDTSHVQPAESIKSWLLSPESQRDLVTAGLSETEIVHFRQAVTSVSCTSTHEMAKILGIQGNGLGWRCMRRLDKHYGDQYTRITLCLVAALLRSNRTLLALYDTPQGAIVVAKLTFDIWSWPGTLSFGIAEAGTSSSSVIGTSVIKGQLVDYGKGKRALEQVLGEAETLFDRLDRTLR